MKNDKYAHVVDVIGYGDDVNRLWYYIPGFNGYEISNDGYVRSMKHWRRYPYGILLQPLKNSNLSNPTFTLTNNDNDRVNVSRSTLIELAKKNLYVKNYPRKTYETDMDSRNRIVMNPKKKPKLDDTKVFTPTFGFVDTISPKKEVIVPLHFYNDKDIKNQGEY